MNISLRPFIFALATISAFGIAQAQEDKLKEQILPSPKNRKSITWQSPVLNALDVNSDHIISQQELKEATGSLLTLDKNGDGVLTTRELTQVFESGSKDTIHDGAFRGELVAERTEISGRSTREILKLLGSKGMLEPGKDELQNYRKLFSFTDRNKDGRHSAVEYVDNGRYLTPSSRAGIFKASDSNLDGFVSEKEYIENRVITDEAKAIFLSIDLDRDRKLTAKEFTGSGKFKDEKLALAVYSAFDANSDGELILPEYLRVWGGWARE